MNRKTFSLSVVSHCHKRYIAHLIDDLVSLGRSDFELILTLNLPEDLEIDGATLPFSIKVINNPRPKGFAANHNAAFAVSSNDYFVILNPDIELIDDPFDVLSRLLSENTKSICAPSIVGASGALEDSARRFPTPLSLLKKVLGKIFKFPASPETIPETADMLMPDWTAGMFIAVPRVIYEMLRGLDERYHMYYEDVDFCARARLAGYQVLVSKDAKVVHKAQRDSHRKIRYFVWHVSSAFRFFTSPAYIRIQWIRMFGV
jgi:N-acetylglucosaminyl-diphospho-decaprenol L-rhamnosyltransferase